MHIALVDGSRTSLLIIYRMLEGRGDEVTLFMDGQEALDYIVATPSVDVLMTSFEVATLPGTDLCWEARVLADNGRPLYVIAMSANNDPQHVISVLDAGADDFMSKPPRADELHARLRVAERTLTMQRRLIELATIDPLSGVLNRRVFHERVAAAIETATATQGTLSLILFNFDHFKRINDLFGHENGDEVIRSVSSLRIPAETVMGRLGGEEFGVLLPDLPLESAVSVADWLRTQIAGQEIETDSGTLQLTASFGVTEWRMGDGIVALFRQADASLYHAKSNGRNRVSVVTAEMVS